MKLSKKGKSLIASSVLLGLTLTPTVINSTDVNASKAPEGWTQEQWDLLNSAFDKDNADANYQWENPGIPINTDSPDYGKEKPGNNSSNENTTENVVSEEGKEKQTGVITVNNKDSFSVEIFNFDGDKKTLSNRGLANNTPWYTDQFKILDGTKYYRVSTNEWVSEKYVTSFIPSK